MDIKNFAGGYNSIMKNMEGKIVTIEKQTKTWKGELAYTIEENEFTWDERAFEPCNIKPTKKELLELPIGTKIATDLEEDNVFVKFDENSFINQQADILDGCDIGYNLLINIGGYGTKIIKIEVPDYKTIYDSSKEVKEMTIAEISKALGYEVKIVKEDK